MKILSLLTLSTASFLLATARADIPRAEWEKYFKVSKDKEVSYEASARHPLMNFEMTKIVRYKEDKDGWSRFVGLDDGGPTDGDTETVWLKTTEKGRFKKGEDGSLELLIPFPLKIGQEWKRGDSTLKLVRKEDLEVKTGTLKDCLVIEVTKEAEEETDKGTEWWAMGHGEVLVKAEMAMGLSVRKKKTIAE